jgi:flagellar hook assembly protein FlgD
LLQNYPNPFNLTTTIQYEIAEDLVDGVDVELALFDILGRKVRTLVSDHRFHGVFSIQWDGLVEGGTRAASGTYFCRLIAGEVVETKRLVLLK